MTPDIRQVIVSPYVLDIERELADHPEIERMTLSRHTVELLLMDLRDALANGAEITVTGHVTGDWFDPHGQFTETHRHGRLRRSYRLKSWSRKLLPNK